MPAREISAKTRCRRCWRSEPQLPSDIRWHMIGHLQKNKVRQVIDKAVLIHSVDTVGLAEQIEKEAVKA